MTDGTGSSAGLDNLHRTDQLHQRQRRPRRCTYGYGTDLKNQVRPSRTRTPWARVTQTWNADGTLASVAGLEHQDDDVRV